MFRGTIALKNIQNFSRTYVLLKVSCINGHLRNYSTFFISSHFFQQNNFSVRNFSQLSRTSPVILIDKQYNALRFSSTDASRDLLENIPEPPAIPPPPAVPIQEAIEKGVETSQALAEGAEPAFATIGLGGWSPAGMIQSTMEYLHITCDLPWWGVILCGTIAVRVVLFPLVVMAQRNGAKLSNNMPQLQHLQAKMTEARQSGNALESARYSQAMMQFMKEKQVNPLKNMIVPLAQAPLFISFFIGLRQMANAPVESMREGGLFWFVDLTVPDQFYLLPIITSLTMLATIEVGTDSARMNSQNMAVSLI
jgi:YidC/Oxa1 family membrane protein insertase